MPLTYREARYIAERLKGTPPGQAILASGFSIWHARNPERIENGEVKAEIARLQSELVKHTLDVGLIDAQEIHEYLSDALRADMRDIRNSDGSFKPQEDWPEIWGRMMEAGDVEVEYASVRSHDGEDTEGRGGWETGGKVQKVKLKFASRVKLLELAMKHKGVDAMVQQKTGDVHIHLEQEKVREKLASARKRHAKIIEAQSQPLDVGQHKMLGSGEVMEVKDDPESAPQQGSTP